MVLEDRRGEAVGAEEGVDPARLALERGRGRRIVQERDPVIAAGDRGEARRERVDLRARLGVDLAQERLAEVGQGRVRKAAHEALRAGDAEARVVELLDRVATVDHPYAGGLEDGRELGGLVAVPVVVPEHRVDRRLEGRADLGQELALLELAVGGQVAREQDRVDLALDAGEGALDLVAVALVAVHVARRGDADRPGHEGGFNRLEAARAGYTPAPWP